MRTAADVENLACDFVAPRHRRVVSVQQVVNKKHIAHLLAVAVNGDGAPRHRRNHKPRHPALIFNAELAQAVNATLAENHRWDAVNAGVIAHILVARALGAAVGRMKVQRLAFGHAKGQVGVAVAGFLFHDFDVFHAAVHLVGGGVNHHWAFGGLADCLQHVEGAQSVDFKVGAGVFNRGSDGNLCGKVDDHVGVAQR